MENALGSPKEKTSFIWNFFFNLPAFKFTLAKGDLIPMPVTDGSFRANNQILEILLLLFPWN